MIVLIMVLTRISIGALGSVVGNPFDVLKTRMMTAEGDNDNQELSIILHDT